MQTPMQDKWMIDNHECGAYNNGLDAIVEPLKGESEVHVLIGMNMGSQDEPPEKVGGMHLREHECFGSNGEKTSREFVEDLEYKGFEINAATNPVETVYFAGTVKTLYDLNDLARLAIRENFKAIKSIRPHEKEFYRERDKVIQNELIMYERNPYSRFEDRVLNPAIFKGSPLEYDVIGTTKSLRSVTIDDVERLGEKFHVPNNTKVVVVGDINPNIIFEEIERTFGTSSDGWKPKLVEHPSYTWNLIPRVVYKEFPDLKDPEIKEQDGAMVCLVYQVNPMRHPDEVGLYLLETVLGQGFSSKLFQELREKHGAGYHPFSEYITLRGNSAMVLALPQLMPSQIDIAVEELLHQVDNLRRHPLSKHDFEGNYVKFLARHNKLLKDPVERAGLRMDRLLEPHYYDLLDIKGKLDSIKRDELQDVAKRNFRGDPLIVIAAPEGYTNNYSRYAS